MIFRRALRPGVAADADALFAAANPEPAVLLAHHRALFVEQSRKRMGLSAGTLTKNDPSLSTGAVPSTTAWPDASCVSSRTGAGVVFKIAVARLARIERQQVGVVPIVQRRGMMLGPVARSKQNRFDEILAGSASAGSVASRGFDAGAASTISARSARRGCRRARSRAMRRKASQQLRPHSRRAERRLRASCASGEVKRASDAPCVKTTSPRRVAVHPSAERRDRSGTTRLRNHRSRPGTAPASTPGAERESGFKQNAPVGQNIGGNARWPGM